VAFKQTFEVGEGGMVWANNPMVIATTWNTRRWVRALVVLPPAYLIVGLTLGAIPPFGGVTDPFFAAVFLVVAGLYMVRPRHADPSFPRRFGYTAGEFVVERVGGEQLRFPWPSIVDLRCRVGEGTRLGAEIQVITPSGTVTYTPCNMDFAMTALWARRAAWAGGLNPAAVSAAPDEGTPATELLPGGTRVNQSPAVALYPGKLAILKGKRLRIFPLIDVDLVPVRMMSVDMLMIGGRGRQIAVVSEDAAMAALRAWYQGPTAPPAPATSAPPPPA
jgi:hypothetical protein